MGHSEIVPHVENRPSSNVHHGQHASRLANVRCLRCHDENTSLMKHQRVGAASTLGRRWSRSWNATSRGADRSITHCMDFPHPMKRRCAGNESTEASAISMATHTNSRLRRCRRQAVGVRRTTGRSTRRYIGQGVGTSIFVGSGDVSLVTARHSIQPPWPIHRRHLPKQFSADTDIA